MKKTENSLLNSYEDKVKTIFFIFRLLCIYSFKLRRDRFDLPRITNEAKLAD